MVRDVEQLYEILRVNNKLSHKECTTVNHTVYDVHIKIILIVFENN